jgi:hypothetical protein
MLVGRPGDLASGDPDTSSGRRETPISCSLIVRKSVPAVRIHLAPPPSPQFSGFSYSLLEKPIFPKEIFRASRRWAEQRYTKLVYFNELDKGGHFAAFEQPEMFVRELRACFRQVRQAAR